MVRREGHQASNFEKQEISSRLCTLSAELAFAPTLASGLLKRFGNGVQLSRVRLLLPTRRAVRAMREAFVSLAPSQAILLPKMIPLGDMNEEEIDGELGLDELVLPDQVSDLVGSLPPAIPPLTRQMLLTRLVMKWGNTDGTVLPRFPRAAGLAAQLAQFIDQLQAVQFSFDQLVMPVPQELAVHWEKTMRFLTIVTQTWPAILEDRGFMDPVERRNRLVAALIDLWETQPSNYPVIAAGSMGTVISTRSLLAAILRLPNGQVLLPGLDRQMDDESWHQVDETHPQFSMKQLLKDFGVERSQVQDWPYGALATKGSLRTKLLSEVMRPVASTGSWSSFKFDPQSLENLTRVTCASQREEAGVISVVIREALNTPKKTIALITPDRTLAHRVIAELRRWGIAVKDSAGEPLGATAPAIFMRLIGEMAQQELAPIPLLAALKHEFSAGGEDLSGFRMKVSQLEKFVLRGLRPEPGFQGLFCALDSKLIDDKDYDEKECGARLVAWLERIQVALEPFISALQSGQNTFSALLHAHVTFANWFASTDETSGESLLWEGEAGEALATFIEDLDKVSDDYGAFDPITYCDLFDELLNRRVVRYRSVFSSRLAIWSPLEARLQRADLTIVGGLNESCWPPEIIVDPWLSRTMYQRLNLPLPERRIGLASHDFSQACAASQVVLTRCEKINGVPAVPSRWLSRFEVLVGAPQDHEAHRATTYLEWFRALDSAKETSGQSVSPPSFAPPIYSRPRKLSVSDIDDLIKNPYSILARYIFGLKPLDPLDSRLHAAKRGLLVHSVLHEFIAAYPDDLPEDALEQLLLIARRTLGNLLENPVVRIFWWASFERIASQFLMMHVLQKLQADVIATEKSGFYKYRSRVGEFLLTAKADRIDLMKNGKLTIIDYKTGTLPAWTSVESGHHPQLPLEGIIAQAAGYSDIETVEVGEVSYWQLGGVVNNGIHRYERSLEELFESTRLGLHALIEAFDNASTPYLSWPWAQGKEMFDEYEHLARYKEWAAADNVETK